MLRIGVFPYINSIFFTYNLEDRLRDHDVELVVDTPGKMFEYFKNGDINCSFLSSIAVNELEDFHVMKDISINSPQHVLSVILFSNEKISRISKIYYSSESKTSVKLLKIILKKKYGISAEIIECRNIDSLKRDDPLLLIGDNCIRFRDTDQYKYKYDLGKEWYDLTGLPMVYGLFVFKGGFVRDDYESVLEIKKILNDNLEINLKNKIEIYNNINMRTGLAIDFIEEYFSKIKFGLGKNEISGLNKFLEYADSGKNTDEIEFI